MKYVFFWLFLLVCLFRLLPVQADDYAFKMGMGIENQETTGQIKLFALRKESHVIYAVHDAIELGGWVDNLGNGRSSSLFGKYMLGVKPGPDVGLYGKAFVGLAGLSAKDSQLGGNVQFSEEVGFGIRDEVSFVELNYSHFSSAGIFTPNHGRDFATFSLGVRF